MDVLDHIRSAVADRYRIERELGAGGMATVYLAHDLKHDREVAIKLLHPELAAALGGDRFLSEIKTTARLQHPHILALLDSGAADGLLYYVMPYVAGETLRTRLERETQLPVPDALHIATEVADALSYAHGHGVIHRDIKPENILLSGGHALVADFGIALAVQSAGGARMTQTGLSLGTPQYMSPEQAMGERVIDARSDIYALGAVLYEMLTGDPPFTGSSVQAIVAKVLTERPTPLRTLRDTIPASVELAVNTALAKLPADRFDRAKAFSDALGNAAFASSHASTQPFNRPKTWNRVTIATTMLAVGALAFAFASMQRRGGVMVTESVVRFALSDDPGLRIRAGMTAPFGISADGRTIVFSAIGANGRAALWVRTIDNPAPRLLAGTEEGVHPSISPDGEWVAFVAGPSRVSKVRIAGSAPTLLAELPGVARSIGWASNDMIISEVTAPGTALYGVPAVGGKAEIAIPLDSAAGERSHGRHLELPELGAIVYSSKGEDPRSSELAVYSMRTRKRARLGIRQATPLALIDGLLVFSTGGGKLMAVPLDIRAMRVTGEPVMLSQRAASYETGTAVAVSPSGTVVYEDPSVGGISRLALVDDAGTTTLLRAEAARYAAPRFSKDGKRIAVAIRSVGAGRIDASDLSVIDVATGEATRVTRTGNATFPEWTDNDRRLVYAARIGDKQELWVTSLDASAPPARLVDIEGLVQHGVATPDGRSVIASRVVGDRYELVHVTLGDHPAIDTLVTPLRGDIRARYPRVSPDGRLVAYSERNSQSVHVRRLGGTGEIQISAGGGCCAVWAPDSRRVFFRNADSLVMVDLQIDPTLAVVRRTARRGFPSDPSISDSDYDLAADGRTFVTLTPVSAGATVFVAVNWIDELRRERRAAVAKR